MNVPLSECTIVRNNKECCVVPEETPRNVALNAVRAHYQ